MPVYQQNKPLPTDQLSVSQGDIEQNYQAIKALVDVNHGTFTGGASPEGKHIKVDVTQIAPPAAEPVAAGTDLTIYNFLNALTTQSEMYVRRNGAAGTPFTASRNSTTDGYFYLPCGLLVRYGRGNATGNSSITLATQPYLTTVYFTMVTPRQTAGNTNRSTTYRSLTIIPATSFTLNVTCAVRTTDAPVSVDFNYLIIGV